MQDVNLLDTATSFVIVWRLSSAAGRPFFVDTLLKRRFFTTQNKVDSDNIILLEDWTTNVC